jgi:hypothetical protein
METTSADCPLDEIDVDTYQLSGVEIENSAEAPKQTVPAIADTAGMPLRPQPPWARDTMLETDIQRAFEALYGKRVSETKRDWYPLPAPKHRGIGIPAPLIDENRPELDSTSRRDLEIFVMRYLDGFGRQDLSTFAGKRSALQGGIVFGPARHSKFEGVEYGRGRALYPAFMGIDPRVAAAGWRSVSPDRHGKEIVTWLLANGYTRSELGRLAPGLIGILGTEAVDL